MQFINIAEELGSGFSSVKAVQKSMFIILLSIFQGGNVVYCAFMSCKRLICPRHGVVELAQYTLPDDLADTQVLVRNTFGAEKHGTMEAFVRKYGNKADGSPVF